MMVRVRAKSSHALVQLGDEIIAQSFKRSHRENVLGIDNFDWVSHLVRIYLTETCKLPEINPEIKRSDSMRIWLYLLHYPSNSS